MDKTHISLCWEDKDGNYSKFPATTILSILQNNNNIFLHLITPGISSENEFKIKKIIKKNNTSFKFYKSFNSEQKKLLNIIKENNKSSFGIGAYLRLLIPTLVSKKIKKIIYIDSDIIVNGNINGLWKIDLLDNFIAGVNHENHPKIKIWKLKQYINSGVMLINLKEIRKINLSNFVQKTIKRHSNDFYFTGLNSCADQDILNLMFNGKIALLPETYNFQVRRTYREGQIIYHYGWLYKPFRFKPVFIDKEYKDLYFHYFDKTPWAGWRPKWNFKKGLMTSSVYSFSIKILKITKLEYLIKRLLNKKIKKRI